MDVTACHILLVEDNALDADLTRRAMQKVEPNVVLEIAMDGEVALQHLGSWEKGETVPVLILLDLKLPKLSGLEVLKIIKSHPKFKLIPIVILTSSNELVDIRRAYELCANSYILKAVDYDQFAQAIALVHRYWCSLNVRPE